MPPRHPLIGRGEALNWEANWEHHFPVRLGVPSSTIRRIYNCLRALVRPAHHRSVATNWELTLAIASARHCAFALNFLRAWSH